MFAVKGPRFVTHLRKLPSVDTALASFFASGLQALGDKALDRWAERLRRWSAGSAPAGRDVFVYLDNDVLVRAPFDALNLARRVTGRE